MATANINVNIDIKRPISWSHIVKALILMQQKKAISEQQACGIALRYWSKFAKIRIGNGRWRNISRKMTQRLTAKYDSG